MLPADARLRRSVDIADTLKRGRRSAARLVVLHICDDPDQTQPARFAFAVGKVVGNSVARHRVTRRLRHIVRDQAASVPAGTRVVIRALPPSAVAPFQELRHDVAAALAKGQIR
jgi:ribonuclease P protein component